MTINADNPAREPAAKTAAGNSVAVDQIDAGEPEAEEEVEAETDQPEGQDGEGEVVEGEVLPPEEDDGSTIEVEHEGVKHKIPAALKPLVMMQKDYTRKTMEVAEARKSVAAESKELSDRIEAAHTTLPQRAKLVHIDEQLGEYAKVDWQALIASQDPEDQRLFHELKHKRETLVAERQQLFGAIQKADNDHLQAQRTQFAKRREETRQANEKNIPNWSVDEDAKMVADAGRFYGFTVETLTPASADHNLYRTLWDAVQYRRLLEKQAKTPTAIRKPVDSVQTAPAAKVQGNRASVKPGLHDDLSSAEWIRRRNAQIAAKNKR